MQTLTITDDDATANENNTANENAGVGTSKLTATLSEQFDWVTSDLRRRLSRRFSKASISPGAIFDYATADETFTAIQLMQ